MTNNERWNKISSFICKNTSENIDSVFESINIDYDNKIIVSIDLDKENGIV